MKPIALFAASAAFATAAVSGTASADSVIPENARAGQCFARIAVPVGQGSTNEQRMLVRDGVVEYSVVDATFSTEKVSYVAKDAHEKLIVVDEVGNPLRAGTEVKWKQNKDGSLELYPVAYNTVEEKVLVSEAYKKIEVVPGKFKTVEERVLLKPATTAWKIQDPGQVYAVLQNGQGLPPTRYDDKTGQVMCLVEEPAVYKTYSKQVLVQQPQLREVEVPAKYDTITRRIPISVQVKRVKVEPKYASYSVRKLATAASTRQKQVNPQYQTFSATIEAERKLEWAEVLCEVNLTRDKIREIQNALQSRGYNPGKIDGIYGRGTRNAIKAYQSRNNLGTGGITYEFLQHIGIGFAG